MDPPRAATQVAGTGAGGTVRVGGSAPAPNATSATLDGFGAAGDRAVRETERAITNVLRSLFGG
jgi:hypothetical protein